MKTAVYITAALTLLTASCALLPGSSSPELSAPIESQNRCGDGVCDGPENEAKCPQDCSESAGAGQNQIDADQASAAAETDHKNGSGTDYRYVSFSGEISTQPNFDTDPDFTGDCFEYTGEYSVELWFPADGGDAVQQRNTIVLTEFNPLYRGSGECRPCEWTPESSAYTPLEFELDADLTLNSITEGDQTVDELIYHLSTVPQKSFTVAVDCPCPGSMDTYPDPAAYPQLLSYFMFQTLRNPIQLNVLETNTVEDFPISPLASISIPEEHLSYVQVPDLDTP